MLSSRLGTDGTRKDEMMMNFGEIGGEMEGAWERAGRSERDRDRIAIHPPLVNYSQLDGDLPRIPSDRAAYSIKCFYTFRLAGRPVLQLPAALARPATLEYLAEKSLSTFGWETGSMIIDFFT